MSISDVVIVGAGIVGAACARECAGRGCARSVVDASRHWQRRYRGGMGHICGDGRLADAAGPHCYSQRLWRELSAELPADVEFEPCGTLVVAGDEDGRGLPQAGPVRVGWRRQRDLDARHWPRRTTAAASSVRCFTGSFGRGALSAVRRGIPDARSRADGCAAACSTARVIGRQRPRAAGEREPSCTPRGS